MYEVLSYLKSTCDKGIILKGQPLSLHDTIIVAYGDSGWANAPNLKSQTGCLIVLTTKNALTTKTDASYADHQSQRTQRVVRSTLSGEAIAADNAVDRGTYVAAFYQELLSQQPSSAKLDIPLYLVTDCKSLYDCVISEAPSLSEKRTMIDLSLIHI